MRCLQRKKGRFLQDTNESAIVADIMEICLIQTDPALGQWNIQNAGYVICNTKADVYILPELFAIGFDFAAQNWIEQAAEVLPNGPTCQQIFSFVRNRSSIVVFGMIERFGNNFFNIAAVIGNACMDRYRQKYPATTSRGRVLPITSGGDYHKVMFIPQWSMGLMVCHDHYQAEKFFKEYKKRGVNAVVLIADASTRAWIKEFPEYCKQYALPAIICNAAGPNGGASCVINEVGQFVPLRTSSAEYPQHLPETSMAAFASL